MQYKKSKDILVLRLFKDEDVVASIKDALNDCRVKNAVLLSGIGMLRDVELRIFKGKGEYITKVFKDDMELINLSGNIVSSDKEYILHFHSTIADHSYKVYGGHFGGGRVAVTLELFILEVPVEIYRQIEPESGLTGMFIK